VSRNGSRVAGTGEEAHPCTLGADGSGVGAPSTASWLRRGCGVGPGQAADPDVPDPPVDELDDDPDELDVESDFVDSDLPDSDVPDSDFADPESLEADDGTVEEEPERLSVR